MKKIFFYITILLAFCGTISAYATKTKAINVFDKAQLGAVAHQTALQKSVVCPVSIDLLELLEEETDDSEDENNSLSISNTHNFYPLFARFSTFLSKKTPCNTHSFSRSLPIFIFIRVLRL